MDFTLREWLIVVGVIVILFVLVDGYRRVRSGSRGRLKMSISKNQKFPDEERMDYFNGELPNGGARVVTHAIANNPDDESSLETVDDDVAIPAFDVDPELRPDPLFADEIDVEPEMEAVQAAAQTIDEPDVDMSEPEPPVAPETPVEAEPLSASGPVNGERKEQPKGYQEVDEVVVMNVFAKDERGFNGAELMRVILACGMRYGDMNIFHRTENKDGGAIQFSMANAVKPGTFDLDNMDDFYTPGVSFFLSLPGPKNSIKAFDYMYETAQCVVKNLNGELKDEIHSAMTSQTIEHSRQKIRDYERRQLSLLR
ncbi:MAG: cell division protein ZipA [Pseudomonadales bacterium]